MPKRRKRPVANPLLKDRVTAIVGPATPPGTTETQATDEPRGERRRQITGSAQPAPSKVHIKARMAPEKAEAMERLTRTLSSYLQTTVKGAEITRALWTLAVRSEREFASLVSQTPALRRPSNGDKLAMAEFEDAIADFLLLALKRTRRG